MPQFHRSIFSTHEKKNFKAAFSTINMLKSTMHQYSHKSPLISECSSHIAETTFQEGIILILFLVFATVTNTETLDIGWVLGREFPTVSLLEH